MNSLRKTIHPDSDGDRSQPLSQAVVEAVAAADGCDPIDLPVLFDYIDPDALDGLFDTLGRSEAPVDPHNYVRFTYHGYEVFVYADGRVNVDPL